MQGSLKLGTLAGIDIRVHYTWFFAFVLIASCLTPQWLDGTRGVMANLFA
jgi:hypothetical protein